VDNFSITEIDSIAPIVSIDPFSDPVSGNVTFSATATDNEAVSSVQFYVDGIAVGIPDTVVPYIYSFDTTNLPNGAHNLSVKAFDSAGNNAMSAVSSFTIQNTVIQPMGNITVTNIVINDNGANKIISDFPLFIDSDNVTSGVVNPVVAGEHYISEITDPNYTRTFSGDCDVNGNISVAENENKSCIITNDDIVAVPPITTTNLVPNYSIESVSASPSIPASWQKGGTGTNTRILTYPVSGYDGTKAVKTEITSYTNGDAKWYFVPIPATSGEQYVFSDFYTSNTLSYVTMQYKLQDGTFKYQDIALNVPAQSSWTQVSKSFTIPTYTQPVVAMTVFHLIKSVGYITVDNFSIQQIPPLPTDPTNLIANPSVETVSANNSSLPYGWNRVTSAGITATFDYAAPAQNGLKSLSINALSYTSGAGAKWYFQSVPVNGGEEYRYSDYYTGSANSFVTVQFLFSNGTYQYMDLMKLTPSTSWKKAEDTFLVPIGAVSLTIIHGIKEVGTLSTDTFVLRKLTNGSFAHGMVSLNFDDGLGSVYNNAIPILNAHNIKSSQYIITSNFSDQPDYVTISEMLAMNAAGHEIGSHTRTHQHLSELSISDAINEIVGSKNDLVALGATPNTVFVYPYGDYNDRVRQQVIDAGYIGARTVHSGYNTKNSDKYALRDQHVEVNTTFEQIKSYIDTAMANNTWLILEIHDINNSGDQYSSTPEIMQQVAEYLTINAIPVVTTAEGIALMN
jgi:peptidoglycan/xylan/chitin deacetylase (PgdA/CDA1 family)